MRQKKQKINLKDVRKDIVTCIFGMNPKDAIRGFLLYTALGVTIGLMLYTIWGASALVFKIITVFFIGYVGLAGIACIGRAKGNWRMVVMAEYLILIYLIVRL